MIGKISCSTNILFYLIRISSSCHYCRHNIEIQHTPNIGSDLTNNIQDPKEMARKLQSKLASLHNPNSQHSGDFCKRRICENQCDNISTCSSNSCHSGHGELNPLTTNTDAERSNTAQKLQEEQKGLGSDFGNSSFASIPYSLPATLDYQFPVHNEMETYPAKPMIVQAREIESSLASREDLQCSWAAESRQTSITHDVNPLNLIQSGMHIR